MFVDGFVDISAGVVFTVLAGFVLGSVDSRAALVLLIPLVGVALATRTLDARIKRYRAADRLASAAVSGMLGDVMARRRRSRSTTRSSRRSPTFASWSMLAATHRGARPRAGRGRVGVQPGRRRRRARTRAVGRPPARWRRARSASASSRSSPPTSAGSASCRGWSVACWLAASRSVSRSTACACSSPTRCHQHRRLIATSRSASADAPRGRTARRPDRVPLDVLEVSQPHCDVFDRRRRARHRLQRAARQLHRLHRARSGRARPRCCVRCSVSPNTPTVTGEVAWNGRVLRPRRVPRPTERCVPPAGAAADLRLGRRQHRPRHRRRRAAVARARARCRPRRHRRDARRRQHDDRSARPAPVRRSTSAGRHGAAPWCTPPSSSCSTTCRARSTSRPSCSCGRTSPPPG